MILVGAIAVLVCAVKLVGGRLERLLEVEVRGSTVAIAGLLIQVAIITVWPGGDHRLHALLHVATYGLAGWFVFVNRHLPGAVIVGAGGLLNLAAIVANGGVMPASASALRAAGISTGHAYANSAAVSHPRLGVLGDVFAVHGPWPFANVFSVGDVTIVVGVAYLLFAVCRLTAPAFTARADG